MKPWLLFFLIASNLLAADHYVRDGASGTGSGNDWTNACDDFAGSCAVSGLVRGDTYYVATGSYASRTFDRAVSGSLTITIKGATVSDHGTDTGWNDSFSVEATQASFGAVDFSTRFWVFNGNHGPAAPVSAGADDPDNYGFTVSSSASCGASPRVVIDTVGDNAFIYVSVRNTCANGSNCMHAWRLGFSSSERSNFVFSHTYAENNQTDMQGSNLGGLTSPLIEYHHSKGQYSDPSCHGEVTAFSGTNAVFRYNYFDQCRGTGCIASNGGDMTGFKIYGNVFHDVTGDDGVDGCGAGGNAAIAGAGSADLINAELYNNTVLQPGMCFGWFYDNEGSGNTSLNNIIYRTCGFNASGTTNFNLYYDCSAQAAPSEANRQVLTAGNSPFVSFTESHGPGTYQLSGPTDAGTTLSSPYDTDMFGNVRGDDGTWDRGAFEFNEGGEPPPVIPPLSGAFNSVGGILQ